MATRNMIAGTRIAYPIGRQSPLTMGLVYADYIAALHRAEEDVMWSAFGFPLQSSVEIPYDEYQREIADKPAANDSALAVTSQ